MAVRSQRCGNANLPRAKRRKECGEALHPLANRARGLNGCCLLKPGVLLVADCFASLIWRVDFTADGGEEPGIRVWASHDSMGYYPGKMKPEQLGVNGVRYAARTHHLYYTATAKKLFMRIAVDPDSLEAKGEPEVVVAASWPTVGECLSLCQGVSRDRRAPCRA